MQTDIFRSKCYTLAFTLLISFSTLTISFGQQASREKSIKNDKFITYYETHGFNKTPRYEQTIEFCQLLAQNSNMLSYLSIGKSPQGRDIPLLIMDKDGLTNPKEIRAKGRSIILAEASIHAGEPDGKDAGLMLIRDIVIYNKYKSILDSVSLLFIPIINVDGHEDFGTHYRINQNGPEEVGARFTAQRYNMNRDFIKADAPETRALLKLYGKWMPELFIDIHVTNGADFQYVTTYGLNHCGFLPPNLVNWSTNVFDAKLKAKMEASHFPIFPYFEFKNNSNPNAGVLPDNFAPQYSNGYASANNRLGMLIENHIYKPYKDRVTSAYLMLKHSLEIIGSNSSSLQKEILIADNFVSSQSFAKDSLPLMFNHDFKDSIIVDFLAWQTKTEISDLSGAKWTYSDTNSPITIKTPLFTSYKENLKIKLPYAYIIPQEQIATIELLDVHSIKYEKITSDTLFNAQTYRINNPEWSKFPYESRITLNAQISEQTESIKCFAGDVIVYTNQPKIKIVAHMLEPKSPTSLLYWGFYNSYARPATEFWVRLNYMEVKGRELLAKDPALAKEFELKKQQDPKFASNPNAILQFFMTKVRANVELHANRYPIIKIFK